jgi:hypothetical protein
MTSIPKYIQLNTLNDDADIYEECYKELPKETQKELDILCQLLQQNLAAIAAKKTKDEGREERPVLPRLGPRGAGALLVALIRNGFLPLDSEWSKLMMKKNRMLWGRPLR